MCMCVLCAGGRLMKNGYVREVKGESRARMKFPVDRRCEDVSDRIKMRRGCNYLSLRCMCVCMCQF